MEGRRRALRTLADVLCEYHREPAPSAPPIRGTRWDETDHTRRTDRFDGRLRWGSESCFQNRP